jgi:hypothetical protein
MLAATAAEFLELQPLRRRLPVLGGRIIPLFAITALQRNNFSGHENRSWLLSFWLKPSNNISSTGPFDFFFHPTNQSFPGHPEERS